MEALVIAVVGVIVVALATALGPRIGIAGPLALVAIGLGVSLLPFVPPQEIDPEIILVGVLPPLLYSSAVSLPAIEFRRDFRPIAGLSILLVLLSAAALAFFFMLVIPGDGSVPRDRARRDPEPDGCRGHLDREEARDLAARRDDARGREPAQRRDVARAAAHRGRRDRGRQRAGRRCRLGASSGACSSPWSSARWSDCWPCGRARGSPTRRPTRRSASSCRSSRTCPQSSWAARGWSPRSSPES